MGRKADKNSGGQTGKDSVWTEIRTPLRQCMGCGRRVEQKSFIRIAAGKDGSLFVDLTGKAGGRGAYLCKDLACLEKAGKRHAFSRSFRSQIDESLVAGIEKDLREALEIKK
ncbi:MAG: YlxR family protein [Lachnospiraceae bacterium]|nr:YlxR family protein [Lachnospiraceae bacterium]